MSGRKLCCCITRMSSTGWVNGRCGVVTTLSDTPSEMEPQVGVRFDHMPDADIVISPIERRVERSPHSIGGRPGSVTRKQLPLALGYAMTVHKVQGQTFDADLEVNLRGWKATDLAGLRALLLVGMSRATLANHILRVRMQAPTSRAKGALKSLIESILNHDREGRTQRYQDLVSRDQEERLV